MIRALVLQSGGHEFKSFPDDWLDLLPVVPGSNPKLLVKIANLFVSFKMALLSNFVIFSWFICFSHFPGPKSLNINTIITCDDSWELIFR